MGTEKAAAQPVLQGPGQRAVRISLPRNRESIPACHPFGRQTSAKRDGENVVEQPQKEKTDSKCANRNREGPTGPSTKRNGGTSLFVTRTGRTRNVNLISVRWKKGQMRKGSTTKTRGKGKRSLRAGDAIQTERQAVGRACRRRSKHRSRKKNFREESTRSPG